MACSLSPMNSYGPSWARTTYSVVSLPFKRCLTLSYSPMDSYGVELPSWARAAYSAASLSTQRGVWLMCYTNFGDTTAWRASSCSACRTSRVNSRHLSERRCKREGWRSRSSVSIAPHASCTINSLEKPNGHKSWKEVLLTLNLAQDRNVHSDSPQTALIQKNPFKNNCYLCKLKALLIVLNHFR